MSEMEAEKVRGIVEAILLTADAPVSPGKLLGILKGLNGRQLRQTIDELQAEYDSAGHACTIAEVAGGFQLATRKEYGPWLRKFHDRGRVRLSQAALETLAIVAFKQPITRVELESIRGVNSGGVLNTLMEHDLTRIVGRSDGIGKPHLFGTTKEFLIHFGLKSLTDLPKTQELKELLAAGERKTTGAKNGVGAAAGGENDPSETVREEEATDSHSAPLEEEKTGEVDDEANAAMGEEGAKGPNGAAESAAEKGPLGTDNNTVEAAGEETASGENGANGAAKKAIGNENGTAETRIDSIPEEGDNLSQSNDPDD